MYCIRFSFFICFLILAIAICNFSCTLHSRYRNEIRTLDSLKAAVISADSNIREIDSAKLKQCSNHVIIITDFIKILHPASMSDSATAVFRNLGEVRWNLETIIGKRTALNNEMKKSSTQLARLSHDLKNNLLPADSVPTYFKYEFKRATELTQTAGRIMSEVKTQMPLYTLIAPQADTLIARLKNHRDI